jgi:hypothetical protein
VPLSSGWAEEALSSTMVYLRARRKASPETSSNMTARPAKLLDLPIELRLVIFDYILQGAFLHVTPRPGPYAYARWTYLRCTRQTSILDGHWLPCCPYAQSPVGWYDQWNSFLPLEPAVLSLLLSCRSLYADFAGLLYSRALFDFYHLEDYLDFVRYSPSTARQLKHMRTRHIAIDCPFVRSQDGHIRTQKDRTFVEALQRMFLHTPRLQSLRLIIESTALWQRKLEHHPGARWARMIVDLATLRRATKSCSQRSRASCVPGSETSSSIVRVDVAVLPENIVQSSPWPSYARLPSFVRPPRVEDSQDLNRTLSWLMTEVMGNNH